MKNYYIAALLSVLSLISSLGYAQSNFYKLSSEAGFGTNYLFADATKINLKPQFHLSFEYNIMRFISLGTKMQFGSTTGEFSKASGNNGVYSEFTNSFTNFQIYSKANLGMFIPKYDLERPLWKYSKGLYAGLGLGAQRNNKKETGERRSINNFIPYTDDAKSGSIFILSTFGYEYFIKNSDQKTRYAINLNYQFIIGLDDELDGNFRSFQRSSFNDFNNTISLGFRYFFGPYGLDKNR